jgi:hypothetical protein
MAAAVSGGVKAGTPAFMFVSAVRKLFSAIAMVVSIYICSAMSADSFRIAFIRGSFIGV